MNAPTRHSVVRGFLILMVLCLLSAPAVLQSMRTAAADSPAPSTAAVVRQDCRAADSHAARERAARAASKSRYQQAGQCYLAAGDKPKADVQFVKAAAADAAVTKRQLTAGVKQAKSQFRQLREAFASH